MQGSYGARIRGPGTQPEKNKRSHIFGAGNVVHIQDDCLKAQDEFLPFGDPEFVRNPYPWFDRLRRERPLHRLPNGTYVVSRYHDIIRYGRLPELTILEPAGAPENAFTTGFGDTMLSREGPTHAALRGRTAKWFTPPLIRQYAAAAEKVVNEILDTYKVGEVIDGHHKLGMLPTHALMCDALQLPPDDPEPAVMAMLDVMRGISSVATAKDDEVAAEGFAYLRSRVMDFIAYKKENPGTGMADALIEAQEKGEITREEMIQTLSLFWGSGAHNPSYLIGAGLEYFAKHPEIYELYREQPDRRRAILNEIIRLFPAELSFVRNTTKAVEILGTLIPERTPVRFLLNSANRDPEVFPDPDEIKLDRPARAMPLSFGVGPHACAGTAIARIGAEIIFDAIAERVKRVEMAGASVFDATDRSRAFVSQSIRLYLM
ncbi:cytochrome P450 [Sphingobium vermicomposti]|uniref:Cytochrome P450 n=1 Tax=Sphingobium vermicomposti TaxID=529005 RepID=A0A846MAL7_9SPHN|nr:cytochrome P450 [Sphingobium vermicomposti]NIJ17861.1 cytochrome P450 [Sphingobium vermicomposti]